MENRLALCVFCNTIIGLVYYMRNLFFLLLGLAVWPVGTYAQTGINRDSLQLQIDRAPEDSTKVRLYYLLASEYLTTDLKKAEELCEMGLALSKKLEYRQGVLNYYAHYGSILSFRGDFDRFLEVNHEALNYARQYADSIEIARTMLNVGISYRQLHDYEAAITAIEEAKSILIHRDFHNYDGYIFNFLQMVYYSMHQYRKGVDNGLRAISAVEKMGDQELLRQANNNLGLNYQSLRMYDSAKHYLNIAATEAQKAGDIVIQITTSLNFALIALKQQQIDKIKVHASKALALSQQYGAYEFEGLSQYGMAYYYLMKKEYPTSKLYADSALALATKYNMPDVKQKSYALLSSLNYAQQNTPGGYHYFNQYEMLSDSVLNSSITNSTIRIEKRLETERKDAQIKLQQVQLDQKTNLTYFLGAGVLALFLILLLSYVNYSNRQKLQQSKIDELETEKRLAAIGAVLKGEEQERTRLAKDLHDGLGGMLSGIKFSLNRVKENLGMTPDNAQAFERSIDMLDSSIREMRRVAHNMMPEILVKYGLDVALKEFCNEIDRSDVMRVKYQSVGMSYPIEQSTAVIVYRIVQELLTNAIKHSRAQQVLVQVHQFSQDKLLAVTVEDDGKGFDTKMLNQPGGMGWRNIQNRVEFLKGRLDVQSSPGKGTSVMVEINWK